MIKKQKRGIMKFELDDLLLPISEKQACGVDLREETDYYVLEELAAGKAETQFSEAESPNWKKVEQLAGKLFLKSKDLWILHYYISSITELYQLSGIAHGITLLDNTITNHWEKIYPSQDEGDDEPDLERINILKTIFAKTGLLYKGIAKTLISASRQMGKFTYHDYLVSTDKAKVPEGKTKPKKEVIQAAVKDSNPKFTEELEKQLTEINENIGSIKSFLMEKNGDDSDLIDYLNNFESQVNDLILSLKEMASEDTPPAEVSAEAGDDVEEAEIDQAQVQVTTKTVKLNSKGIHGHADVLRLFSQINEWFAENEPSSPVPYLLKRAEELIGKNFVEIMENVASSALQEVNHLFNIKKEPDPDQGAPPNPDGSMMQPDSYMDNGPSNSMDEYGGPPTESSGPGFSPMGGDGGYNEPSLAPQGGGPMGEDMYR